jgi:PhzF family phenazine biosynthesis protein
MQRSRFVLLIPPDKWRVTMNTHALLPTGEQLPVEVHILNAFSLNGTGGNPAGVVLQADGLSREAKQQVAAEAGFAETAFVSASSVADLKLEFFTPLKQIPHCGHATIATFSYLKQTGAISGNRSSKETIDGSREILFVDSQAFMEQRAPTFTDVDEVLPEILKSLHILPADLLPGHVPSIVNTGNSFLVVPMADEARLAAVTYDREAVYALSERFGLIGFYVFSPASLPGFDAGARMFAPYYGIPEEAATGMAAGPLVAYLFEKLGMRKEKFHIMQGHLMEPPSPSVIRVNAELDGDRIRRLFAGGSAYRAGKKTVVLR